MKHLLILFMLALAGSCYTIVTPPPVYVDEAGNPIQMSDSTAVLNDVDITVYDYSQDYGGRWFQHPRYRRSQWWFGQTNYWDPYYQDYSWSGMWNDHWYWNYNSYGHGGGNYSKPKKQRRTRTYARGGTGGGTNNDAGGLNMTGTNSSSSSNQTSSSGTAEQNGDSKDSDAKKDGKKRRKKRRSRL